ncbi:MAG: endonuclease III [Candidatus Micrarchaeota archaeon]|nr:endonuclease III [Candidatus Micrarchaeota archaeon]
MTSKILYKNFDKVLGLMLDYGKRYNAPVLKLKDMLITDYDHLIYAILSPRSTDKATIKVFLKLKRIADNFTNLDALSLSELMNLLKGIGLYKIKAQRLKSLANILKDKPIPTTKEQLLQLPGVGDKVASVYLSSYLDKDEIAVDTHVYRIANRLGIAKSKSPIHTKKLLMKKIPKKFWKSINIAFVAFGQTICKAKPKCDLCEFKKICYYYKHTRMKTKE